VHLHDEPLAILAAVRMVHVVILAAAETEVSYAGSRKHNAPSGGFLVRQPD